jgi:hypothetical protein
MEYTFHFLLIVVSTVLSRQRQNAPQISLHNYKRSKLEEIAPSMKKDGQLV